MISDNGRHLYCDKEGCENDFHITKLQARRLPHHPEFVLLAKAEKKGWRAGMGGGDLYCPEHAHLTTKIRHGT